MEISIIDASCIKIRGKYASLVLDPQTSKSKSKITADAIVLLNNQNISDFSNVENYRVIISQAGEYEVSGAMIAGKKTNTGIVYEIVIDNITITLGKVSEISKVLDKIESCQILLLNVDSEINQSVIGSLEPSAVLLYGEKKIEAAKSLDKGDAVLLQKYTLSKEKAGEGMEVVVLNA